MENYIPGILVFGFIAVIGIVHWKMVRRSKRLPVLKEEAVILNKRMDEWRNSASSPMIKEYYVTFQVEDRTVELKVTWKKDYEKLMVGEEGIVSYQEKRLFNLFIDFEPNNEG